MMNRIVGFILFLSVFLSIYFGAHLYVFTRFSSFFAIKRTFVFYLVVILVSLSFIIASIMERTFNGEVSRFFYTITSVWMGVLFLLLCTLLVYEFVKLFVKLNPHTAGIIILVVVLTLTFYGIINAFSVRVNEVEVPIPNLDKELKIVQLSDLHIGTIHKSPYLEKVVKTTNSLNPDMVLITGDLVDGSSKMVSRYMTPLNKIKSKTFFSLGNHEHYEGDENILHLLNGTNVTVLQAESVVYKGIQVVGVSHPDRELEKANPMLKNIELEKNKPSVLMYHPPTGLEDASNAGINLQLSGHTHAGQIMPFNLISRLFYPYQRGLHKYKDTYLYVSPGTGTWGPPMRLGSRSEITLIRLVKA